MKDTRDKQEVKQEVSDNNQKTGIIRYNSKCDIGKRYRVRNSTETNTFKYKLNLIKDLMTQNTKKIQVDENELKAKWRIFANRINVKLRIHNS